MSEWSSYRLQHFIPFTEDIYFRLTERMGETFWPLQLLTLALGAVALILALKSRGRLALLLIAPVWAFVAVAFFMQRYGELIWAGDYISYAFLAQATLLLLIASSGKGRAAVTPQWSAPAVIGGAVVLYGLLVHPLMAPLSGASWFQAEVFGVHPDPTAIVTLGLVVVASRNFALWAAAVVPLIWLVISALTLMGLDATGYFGLFAVSVTGVIGLIWRSFSTSGKSQHDAGAES